MQGESVYKREVFTSARRCLREFKGDVKQNLLLYKKKIWRGAPQKSKTRHRANRRGALSQIEEPENFFIQKSRNSLSKAGIAQNHEAGGLSGRIVTHHVRLGALRKPRAEPGFEPRFSKDQFFRFVVTRHLHRQPCGNYGRFVRKRVTGTVHPSTGCRQIVKE